MLDPTEFLSDDDIKAIASKYDVGGTSRHAQRVVQLSQTIFDLLSIHDKLNAHDAATLHYAAYLHDIGHFVDTETHDKQSSYLIRNDSALAALPDELRLYLACIAGSHRKNIRKKLYDFDHAIVLKALQLIGILRTADALEFMEQSNLEIKNITFEHNDLIIHHSDTPVKELLPRFSKKSRLLKETSEIGLIVKKLD